MFFSTAVVLYNIYSSGMDSCVSDSVTGYSDYMTGFCEPLSTSYICQTGLETIIITGRVLVSL